MTFQERVLQLVSVIPRGKTMAYGEVAAAAGRPGAARAVGNIVRHNFDPSIPCHRVIRADGQIGGYNRGAARKLTLLKQENAI